MIINTIDLYTVPNLCINKKCNIENIEYIEKQILQKKSY